MKSADGPSLCSVDFVRGLLHALATALHSGSKPTCVRVLISA